MAKLAKSIVSLALLVAIVIAVVDFSRVPRSGPAPAIAATASGPLPATGASTSAQVAALEKDWYAANDLCRGSENKHEIDVQCTRSDAIQAQLGKIDWCWEYKDWRVFPTQYEWHHCEQSAPAGFKPDPMFTDETSVDDLKMDNGNGDVAASSAADPSTTFTVTASAYSQIENGMTYEQVKSIIGAPGEEQVSSNAGGMQTVMVSWKNWDGSNMMGEFQNDHLMMKAQFGLH